MDRVRLTGGRQLNADLVAIGIGVTPATQWLADAPLHLVRAAVGVDPGGHTNAWLCQLELAPG